MPFRSATPHPLDPARGLWQMIPAPVLAGLYFLICYISTSVQCARTAQAGLDALRRPLGLVTAATLLLILWCGQVAWQRWRLARHGGPARREVAFIARMACLLAVLSFVGVLFVGAPLALVGSCR